MIEMCCLSFIADKPHTMQYLKVLRNIAKEEKYHTQLISLEGLIDFLKGNMTNDEIEISVEIRSLSKEMLWLMRDELALSKKYSDDGECRVSFFSVHHVAEEILLVT